MWGSGGRFPQSLIHFNPVGWWCWGGGGICLLDIVLYAELCLEVKPLTLSYTIFDQNGTTPRLVYLLLTNGSSFTYLVFFLDFFTTGFLPVFSKFSNTHSLCRDYPAFTPSSMRKSSISAHFVKEVHKRVLCCFFLGQ